MEENSQAVLQAVDVQLICIARHLVGLLLLDCLAHWKQTQTLNWFSQSTKFERYGTVLDMNANHELAAQIAAIFALLNLCHFSSEKCSHNKMKEIRLRSAPFLNMPDNVQVEIHHISSKFKFRPSIVSKKHSTNTCRECNVLGHWVDWEGIADELKATIPVLQGQQQGHSNPTLSNRVLVAFTFQRAQQRNKGMEKHHTKSLV